MLAETRSITSSDLGDGAVNGFREGLFYPLVSGPEVLAEEVVSAFGV